MFAGQPQPVEIHHRGIWYSGELIGWRHETTAGWPPACAAASTACATRRGRTSRTCGCPTPSTRRAPSSSRPWSAVRYRCPQEDQDDATRPHALLAALRQPTGQADARDDAPAGRRLPGSAANRPARVPGSPEPIAERRRHSRPDRRSAYLSVV